MPPFPEFSIENEERMENCPWKRMIWYWKIAICFVIWGIDSTDICEWCEIRAAPNYDTEPSLVVSFIQKWRWFNRKWRFFNDPCIENEDSSVENWLFYISGRRQSTAGPSATADLRSLRTASTLPRSSRPRKRQIWTYQGRGRLCGGKGRRTI